METEIDKLLYQTTTARRAIATADDTWLSLLEGMRERVLRVAAEIKTQEQLRDDLIAHNRSAMDRARVELDKLNLEIKQKRDVSARLDKDNDHKKGEINRHLLSLMPKQVA
jgi:hypothetical protein